MVKGYIMLSTIYTILWFLGINQSYAHFVNTFCDDCEKITLSGDKNFLLKGSSVPFIFIGMMVIMQKNYKTIKDLVLKLSEVIEYNSEFEIIL